MHRSVPFSACLGNYTGNGEGNLSFRSNRVDKQQSVRDWVSSPSISLVYMHTQKRARNLSISHITYHRPQPQPRPRNLTNYTTPYKSGENRTTTTQNQLNLYRARPTHIHTYLYLPTYLPFFFIFSLSVFHLFISFLILMSRSTFYASCFMLYVFFVSFLFYIDR